MTAIPERTAGSTRVQDAWRQEDHRGRLESGQVRDRYATRQLPLRSRFLQERQILEQWPTLLCSPSFAGKRLGVTDFINPNDIGEKTVSQV
jgi:hypothetical protein